MEEFWTEFVTVLLKVIIAALLPVALHCAVVALGAHRRGDNVLLRPSMQLATINWMLRTLVMAAEQSWLRDEVLRQGEEKREWVLAEARRWLEEVGFPVDVQAIEEELELIVERA